MRLFIAHSTALLSPLLLALALAPFPTTAEPFLNTLLNLFRTPPKAIVPSALLPSSPPPLPHSIGYLLFPGFQALDVFGPLDALNFLSWRHNLTLALVARTLAPVSTQIRDPAYNRANSTFAQLVLPTHTLDAVPPLDVLVVPGGIGTRSPDLAPEIQFIANAYPSLRYLLTVCTGAGLAAQAGVLDGRNATTNKAAWADTIALGPRTHWVAHARWVHDGNIWSSSGVSAGIDVLFAWMADVFGEDTARGVADKMEYERHLNASWDPFAELYNLTDVGSGGEGMERVEMEPGNVKGEL